MVKRECPGDLHLRRAVILVCDRRRRGGRHGILERLVMGGERFVEQTLVALATDTPEVIVDAIRPLRDNPGAKEHGFFEAFNRSIVDNPIPVSA